MGTLESFEHLFSNKLYMVLKRLLLETEIKIQADFLAIFFFCKTVELKKTSPHFLSNPRVDQPARSWKYEWVVGSGRFYALLAINWLYLVRQSCNGLWFLTTSFCLILAFVTLFFFFLFFYKRYLDFNYFYRLFFKTTLLFGHKEYHHKS